VDETRPRNQGAALTAWELGQQGIDHHLIVDNAGGHLMQHGLVDLVIVGTDRTTRCGDAANKIGTYLKALAAKDNGIPFYVALPASTFDFNMRDGEAVFWISGTATGAERELPLEAYCRVDSFNPKTNEVWCTGHVKASSETMSHGAVYEANDAVRCVIHVHSRELFELMLAGQFAKTPKEAEYGTPELAEAVQALVESAGTAQGVFVLAGHQDGVMAYGSDIESARDVLLALYQAIFFS
jgi:hypothetical protein